MRDTIKGNQHLYRIKITPNRKVNRYDIFTKTEMKFNNLKANGVTSIKFKSNIASKTSGKVLSYYVVENLPLELEFSINKTDKLDLELIESSFDLLSNPLFSMAKRKPWMIPKPFVLTDAVIVKQKIKATPILEDNPKRNLLQKPVQDSLNVEKDTLQ